MALSLTIESVPDVLLQMIRPVNVSESVALGVRNVVLFDVMLPVICDLVSLRGSSAQNTKISRP
jgi:hypothetical protein